MLVNKHGQPSLWPGKHLCYTNACVTAAGKDSIMQFTALIQLLGRERTLLHTLLHEILKTSKVLAEVPVDPVIGLRAELYQ